VAKSVTASSPAWAPTKWGDRAGRRRDILAAARAQMRDGGYGALNMRDIAAGAGVSPGTLYSYFATKEEIFATLYCEAIDAHNQRIGPICEHAIDLEVLVVELATTYLDLYRDYGRYFTQWSSLQAENAAVDNRLPADLSAALRSATVRYATLVHDGLRRAAAAEGRRLLDEAIEVTFLWAVFNGIGDHATSGRRKLTPVTTDELVHYAARTIAAGMTAPPR
jgi:AcrR family transcriptional regulator